MSQERGAHSEHISLEVEGSILWGPSSGPQDLRVSFPLLLRSTLTPAP